MKLINGDRYKKTTGEDKQDLPLEELLLAGMGLNNGSEKVTKNALCVAWSA